MTSHRLLPFVALLGAGALLAGCAGGAGDTPGADETVTIRVAAVTSPATDIVEAAAAQIEDGYEIEPLTVTDYVTVNNMLAAGDIEASFSQHEPYMQEFNEKNDASLEAVQTVYNFVIGFYSQTVQDIDDLPDGARVAIPNDSSNAGRALKLLADNDLLTLDPAVDPYAATVDDIAENPRGLEFLQVEIAQLNTAYEEADLVFQWPSHIAALGLTPADDGLITELDDRFALQLVVGDDVDDQTVAALRAAFTSDAVLHIIEANPSIEPAF
ncbi:MetQ/NlpA family ABC transporter substrate-binding protein [Planococcus sp. APC 4015]|nr:MetQ/NlpA family ABC transporter substrate-binding protein [Planococcus sp. APC 4015]